MQWVFYLLYTQHGGSGLAGLTYSDVMSMELDEIFWWLGKLQETREAEAAAIRKSGA